jgi:hypothetical protein
MTKADILALLLRNDKAVERAMVVLFLRQTSDEQDGKVTRHSNGRGFNYFHAERGTYFAKWILSGRKLTGSHLAAARKMACYYARQLLEVAAERQAVAEAVSSM